MFLQHLNSFGSGIKNVAGFLLQHWANSILVTLQLGLQALSDRILCNSVARNLVQVETSHLFC